VVQAKHMAAQDEAAREAAAAGRRATARMEGVLLARRIKEDVPDLAWGLYFWQLGLHLLV